MSDKLVLLSNCYIENCNKEFKQRKMIRDIWFAKTNKINDDFKNKIITRKQFITRLNKLDNNYFDLIENISLHKCEINKCYNLVKNHLDYLADKNNYKKKDTYTVEDYIEILKINNKNKNNII
jgi:hypothetical protein